MTAILSAFTAIGALLVTYGGYPFEYPPLFPLIAIVLAAVITMPYYKHRREKWHHEFRVAIWMPVIGVFAAALVGSLILAWAADRFWGLPNGFSKEEVGILVAELPNQKEREQQTAYERELIAYIQNAPELKDLAKVRLIERPLPQDFEAAETEALKIGQRLRASFVLRPYAVGTFQDPWLTVVNSNGLFASEFRLGKFPTTQLAQLETLPVPREIGLLAETVIALGLNEKKSWAKAAQILDDVLKSPNLPKAASSRWALNFLRGNDLALSGDATEAIAEYREAIQLKPDLIAAHNNLGLAFVAKGQYDAAIAEFREAIRVKPDLAGFHTNLGNALDLKGQYDAAIAELREAVRLEPYSAAAHTNLGNALGLKGQYDAAIAEYKEAIRLKPDFTQAHINLGNAFYDRGLYDAAIAEYREAIRVKPYDAEAHNDLGAALAAKGQYDAAIAEYGEAIRVKPEYAKAHNNLGIALAIKCQYDAAVADFREAIRFKPDFAEAHSNLGLALSGKGQYDAAIAEYGEAIRLKPDYAKAHYNLGLALFGKGQYDAAIAEYREAIGLEPAYAKAHYSLGAALKRTGQSAEASREFIEAHRLNPLITAPN